MNTLAYKILTAPMGKTHIFSVGQAGFIIRSASGQLLAIDLYLSECVERLEGHKGYKRLLPRLLDAGDLVFDVVICTHPHWDHFDVDSVPEMIANGRTKLICSTGCENLVNDFKMGYYSAQIRYVQPHDSLNIGDFSIELVDCDHGMASPDALGVVVTVDGKRIYETGDTCLRLDYVNERVATLDIMIAPINGAYGNLNEEEGCRLAQALQPKVTIPCHYGMFASHGGDVGKFYKLMGENNMPFLIMSQGEQYTLD